MSKTAIELAEQISQNTVIDRAHFERLLGTTFHKSEENSMWVFYEFSLDNSPFETGRLGMSRGKTQAFLTLSPSVEAPLTQTELSDHPWGEPDSEEINPSIPPEGTVSYIYKKPGVDIALEFTTSSRVLRTLGFEWGYS